MHARGIVVLLRSFRHLYAENALVGNNVSIEESALPIIGEVTAANHAGARDWASGAFPEVRVAGTICPKALAGVRLVYQRITVGTHAGAEVIPIT